MTPKRQLYSCAVKICKREDRQELGDSLSWHRMTTKANLIDVWRKKIWPNGKGEELKLKKHFFVCSRHFEPQYLFKKDLRTELEKTAIPTLNLENVFEKEEKDDLEMEIEVYQSYAYQDIKDTVLDFGYFFLARLANYMVKNISNSKKSEKRKATISEIVTPKRMRIQLEHNYSLQESPGTTIRKLKEGKFKCRKKLHLKTKTISRKNLRVENLVKKLKSIDDTYYCDSGILKLLVAISKKKKVPEYSDDIKQFAVTLHFYSPKAYEFLRSHIKLPHPSCLSAWMKSANCDPGLNFEVIENLKLERLKDQSNSLSDIVMIVDEMAIRKDTTWDPSRHKYMGYWDFGSGPMDGDGPLASNAMVCLIAGISGGWKCPVGYIFTDKCDGMTLNNFVNKALKALTDAGFIVHSITADGGTPNVGMFGHLGIKEKLKIVNNVVVEDNIVHYFTNPDNSKNVYAIYDVVHMMKLWRNLLSDYKEITWSKGKIEWKFVEELHEVQQLEKISAANKINQNHIDFQRHKMKVKFATQVFSASVANAIDFCRDDVMLPNFQDSKPTTEFFKMIDKAFDILNSRNPKQSGFKEALRKGNLAKKIDFLSFVCSELQKITYQKKSVKKGVISYTTDLLCNGNRKRAVLGTIISIRSIVDISKTLLERATHPFSYVMTYRFSQDLLELLFNKIRGKLGKNDNPNVVEFINIMKQIWHQNLLKSTNTGNCINYDQDISKGLFKLQRQKKKILAEEDLNYDYMFNRINLDGSTSFYENCLAYIAGNVVKAIQDSNSIKCSTCMPSLLEHESDKIHNEFTKLIQRKDNGGLITPSKSVFKICKLADDCFKVLTQSGTKIPKVNNLDVIIRQHVTKNLIGKSLFPSLQNHINDYDPHFQDSHLIIVMKHIIKHFLKVRLFAFGKSYRREMMGVSHRHSNTKTTLFRHE